MWLKYCLFIGHNSYELSINFTRKSKKLWRWLLKRKRHFKIELCCSLSVLRLFHVGHIIRNGYSVLSLDWHEQFSYKGRERKAFCCRLTLSSKHKIWNFHVVFFRQNYRKWSRSCSKAKTDKSCRGFPKSRKNYITFQPMWTRKLFMWRNIQSSRGGLNHWLPLYLY